MNPPNERAILFKGNELVEFLWNPSEHGVTVTEGHLNQVPGMGHGIEWNRQHGIVMKRENGRKAWRELKAQGYMRKRIVVDFTKVL